ncbi:MAG: hypothetical protein MI919_12880 [Holophagales bacterium]|nr:hypothetical protein [Holophagales bacterium]
MSKIPGGSAFAMVQQVAEGFLLVTERTFRRMGKAELDKLTFELEKRMREIRAEPTPEEHMEAQKKHRRLQRLSSCRQMLRSHRMKRRV